MRRPTALALLALMMPLPALAQSLPNLGDMFANFSEASLALMDLVVGFAFVTGIVVSVIGLIRLKEYAEQGGRVKVSAPIGLLLVGACLIALPGMIDTATETMSLGANTGKNLLSEPGGEGMPAQMAAAIAGVLLFIKLIGHIAFFRGFLILKRLADGDQQATVGRAVTHIFGGAAAININATAAILAATFAPGVPMPV